MVDQLEDIDDWDSPEDKSNAARSPQNQQNIIPASSPWPPAQNHRRSPNEQPRFSTQPKSNS